MRDQFDAVVSNPAWPTTEPGYQHVRETCGTCKGERVVLEWGRSKRTCGYCDGSGFVLVWVYK